MNPLKSFLTASLFAAATFAGPVAADPKPADAAKIAPQTVANFYAGRSNIWKGCKGSIYFGAGWEAQAMCSKDGPAVGLGTWKIEANGSLCYELTWYWPEGSNVGSKPGERTCIEHVTDTQGRIWHKWPKDVDWWIQSGDSKNWKTGFQNKRKITRLRKKLGV